MNITYQGLKLVTFGQNTRSRTCCDNYRTPRLTQLYVRHFQTDVILKKIKWRSWNARRIFTCGNKGGGRMLLAIMLWPIQFHCAVVWISADFLAYTSTYIVFQANTQFPLIPGLPGRSKLRVRKLGASVPHYLPFNIALKVCNIGRFSIWILCEYCLSFEVHLVQNKYRKFDFIPVLGGGVAIILTEWLTFCILLLMFSAGTEPGTVSDSKILNRPPGRLRRGCCFKAAYITRVVTLFLI
jgi:hypothetical protein